jgi:hypothetical protein
MGIWTMKLRLGWAALLLGSALFAQSAPPVQCPKSVSVADPQLTQVMTGWEVFFDPVPHSLSRVTFFEGPVAENSSLAPDSESRSGKSRTAKWLFRTRPERPYWLACYYSATSLALSRALPAGVKGCTIAYNPSVEIDGMPEIESFSCD